MTEAVKQPPVEQPLVSVVIACVNGMPSIGECCAHLLNQEGSVPAEIIVVDVCGPAVRQELRQQFPQVKVIEAEGRPSIPALRAMGMKAARGRMIAILEDHCNVDRRWMHVIERAHRAGHQAIGGAVENGATDRLVDWAVYFCEYARFMLPVGHGIVPEITGNNSVYDRQALEKMGSGAEEEVWEGVLHQKLREMNVPFYSDPGLVVSHKKEFGFGYFLSQRYHFSRSLAGERMKGAPAWKKLAFAGAVPFLLPPLLYWRMLKTVMGKNRHKKEFFMATPIIAVFLVPWVLGEIAGALLGQGDSAAKVE